MPRMTLASLFGRSPRPEDEIDVSDGVRVTPATSPDTDTTSPPPDDDPAADLIARERALAEREAAIARREKEIEDRARADAKAARDQAVADCRTRADNFGVRLAAERKLFGKVASHFADLYHQAALDDLDHAIEAGPRTAAFDAFVACLPVTATTAEQAGADDATFDTKPDADGNRVLPNATGGGKPVEKPQTEAAYRAMVARTPALSHLLADEPKLAAVIATLKAQGTIV